MHLEGLSFGLVRELAMVAGWPILVAMALFVWSLVKIVKGHPQGFLARLWLRMWPSTTNNILNYATLHAHPSLSAAAAQSSIDRISKLIDENRPG